MFKSRFFLFAFTCVISAGLIAMWSVQASPKVPELHALVVGIDNYEYINSLKGAVNDARALREALQIAGAKRVVYLEDSQATRSAILDSLDMLAREAPDGSVIWFSYSGHGARLLTEGLSDSLRQSDEVADNVLVLGGFQGSAGYEARNKAPEVVDHLIIDDEIRSFVQRYPNHSIVTVFDECNAGSMNRSADASEKTYRNAGVIEVPLTSDVLTRPATNGQADEVVLANEVFFAAGNDEFLVPEFSTPSGQRFGALSQAIAKAIRGDADRDQDGRVTLGEVRSFVMDEVTILSEGEQSPVIRTTWSADRSLFGPPAQSQGATAWTFPEIRVKAAQALPAIDGVVQTAGEDWFLSWNGEVVERREKEVVATNVVDSAAFTAVVNRWRLVHAMKENLIGSRLQVKILEVGKTKTKADYFYRGDSATMQVTGLGKQVEHAMFNIAEDGTLQFFAGLEPEEGMESFIQEFIVDDPFGRDYWVILEWPETDSNGKLITGWLEANNKKPMQDIQSFLEVLSSVKHLKAGAVPFYSKDDPGKAEAQL